MPPERVSFIWWTTARAMPRAASTWPSPSMASMAPDGICTLVSAFSGDAEAALGHVREMIREGTAKSCRWLTPFWNDLAKLADE